jgi:phage gpG-like protein
MSTQTFSTNGMTWEFEDNSGEILKALENARDRALESIGQTAVKYAQDELTAQGAVDTGRLRNSITHAVDGDDVYIGTNVEYAPYIEFGTGHYSALGGGTTKPSWVYQDEFGEWHRAYPQPARPYIKPAAADHASEYRKLLEESMNNA